MVFLELPSLQCSVLNHFWACSCCHTCFFNPVFFAPPGIAMMWNFWKECSVRVLGLFSQATGILPANIDVHIQVKTTVSLLPPGNSRC